jgi:hypothetical protein
MTRPRSLAGGKPLSIPELPEFPVISADQGCAEESSNQFPAGAGGWFLSPAGRAEIAAHAQRVNLIMEIWSQVGYN